jgi:dolichyl-diphosphooligosaccharide--protein glycosyltransferase
MEKSEKTCQNKNARKKDSKEIFVLVAAILAGFIMRMLSYASVTVNGGITFAGYDDFYHMRRIIYTVHNFPHALNFDSYINFPYGFEIGWPPFFDISGALLAKILGGGQPDLHTIEFAGALLPVLLGTLTIIPLYIAASSVFDRKTGLLGAFIFAVIPAHLYISRFGAADHHVAEALLSTAAYACFILALKIASKKDLSLNSLKNISSEKDLIKSLVLSAASGLFLSLLIFTWVGGPIFVSFIVLYAFIQATIDFKAGKRSDYLFLCSIACIFAALIFTIPLTAGSVRPGLEMSAVYISWFQVFYVLSMLAGTIILWGFSLYISKRNLDWKLYPGVLILVLGAGILSLRIFSPESYSFMIEGLRFFTGKGEYIGTISEAVPLFLTAQGKLDFGPVLGSFGLTFFTALAAFFLLWLECKGEKSKPERVYFLLWTVFLMYLTLSQRRFSYLLSVNVSILTAYFLWVLLEALDFETEVRKLIKPGQKADKNISNLHAGKDTKLKMKSKTKTKNEPAKVGSLKSKLESKNSPNPDYFKIISSLVLIGLIFVPCIWAGAAFAKSVGSIDSTWQDSLKWLESSSPETSYYLQPSQTPEYGVLSWWDYGNWIIYLSKRPAVSNNFQTGINDSANFFITGSEQEAKAVIEKLKVKYVITDTLMANGKFPAITELAGKDIRDYYEIKTVKGKTGLQTSVAPKNKYLNTQVYKLQELDGANLGNFRLIHESVPQEKIVKKKNTVKVFEYVSGARLSGTASPSQTITASLELSSNTGRKFEYKNKAVADEKGSFVITVPYSTEKVISGVTATSTYSISSGENITATGVQVKESDILNGNTIEISNS